MYHRGYVSATIHPRTVGQFCELLTKEDVSGISKLSDWCRQNHTCIMQTINEFSVVFPVELSLSLGKDQCTPSSAPVLLTGHKSEGVDDSEKCASYNVGESVLATLTSGTSSVTF